MLIKYCSICARHPYTENLSVSKCPVCNSELLVEAVSDESLLNRPKLINNHSHGTAANGNSSYKAPVFNSPFENSSDTGLLPPQTMSQNQGSNNTNIIKAATSGALISSNTGVVNATPGAVTGRARARRTGTTVIQGKVSQYTCSEQEAGQYRRFPIHKIIDAVVYHQRLDDVLHRFNVRTDNGADAMGHTQYTDTPVNVHGIIAGGGMHIANDSEVEIEGRFKNGVLMASKVSVIQSGNYSRVKFQHSASAIINGILAVVALVVMLVFVIMKGGSFFSTFKYFLKTWLIISAVSTILYFLIRFSKFGILARMASQKKGKFPLVGILLFSLIATLFFTNAFGVGTTLTGLVSKLILSFLPIVLVVVILLFIYKLFLF